MPTGIHRHAIVFVAYRDGIYAIKEFSENQARVILSDLAYQESKFGGTSATGKNIAAMK
jgi:hypothetical protein